MYDMKILKEIYSEYGIVMEEEKPTTGPDFKLIPLPQEDIQAILDIYNNLSKNEQEAFNQNLRKYTLPQFITNSKKLAQVFAPFFEASKKKGRGRGEFPTVTFSKKPDDKSLTWGTNVLAFERSAIMYSANW